MNFRLLIAIVFLLNLVPLCIADIHNAASCSYTDVSSAIGAASSGDTVVVPSGSCIWNTRLTIDKGITFQGAGVGVTTITSNLTSASDVLVHYHPADPLLDEPFEMLGFTFDTNAKSMWLDMTHEGTVPLTKIKIHDNSILNLSNNGASIIGIIYGVVYKNTFTGKPAFEMIGMNSGLDFWNNYVPVFGDSNCLYFEDNTVTLYDTMFGTARGIRYCARYNTFTYLGANSLSPWFDGHGNQWQGLTAVQKMEIYGNKILDPNRRVSTILDQRGGMALVFFNKLETANDIGIVSRDEFDDRISPIYYAGPGTQIPQHVSNSYYWNNRNTAGKLPILSSPFGGTATGGGNDYVDDDSQSLPTCGYYCSQAIKLLSGLGAPHYKKIYITTAHRVMISPENFLNMSYNSGVSAKVIVPDGTYAAADLAAQLKTSIDTALGCVSTITWNATTKKFTISVPGGNTIRYFFAYYDAGFNIGFNNGDGPAVSITGDFATNSTIVIASTWGATNPSAGTSYEIRKDCCDSIHENIEYFGHNESFDGTSGVGCGILSSRPATCTAGVGYWATNQSCSNLTSMIGANPTTPISGTLYKCTATNTWTAFFTPYAYPHPLRLENQSFHRYYVSWSTGDDLNNGETPAAPWKSLSRLSTGPTRGWQSGDIVAFKKGDTWDMGNSSNNVGPVDGITRLAIRIPRSGLTYSSYGTGVRPKFYGHRSSLNINESCAGIYQPSSTYSFRVNGIAFDNLGWGWNDSNNDYRNSGIITTIATNSTVTNCTFNDMYNGLAFTAEGTAWTVGNYNEISYNTITNIHHSGIYSFHGANAFVSIHHNTIYNCDYNGLDFVGRGNNHYRITQNYISGSNNAIEFSGGGHNEVFGNVCYDNHAVAGPYSNSLGGIALVQGSSYNKVYGNTFYGNDYGFAMQGDPIACKDCPDLACLEALYCMINNEFKNNILANSTVAEAYIPNEGQKIWNVFSNNLYYRESGTKLRYKEDAGPCGTSGFCNSSWWTSNIDPTGVYADPLFVNISGSIPEGLMIKTSSPAKDTGLDLGQNFSMDFLGLQKPQGSAWDIGAFEYVSTYARADTNHDGCVELSELLSFISRWRVSSLDVSLSDVIDAISLWKGGCS